MPTYTPKWRFRSVLKSLGTTDDVRWMIFGKGYTPPREETIQGWRNRNSVPGKWVPVIIEIALDKQVIHRLGDLKQKPRAEGYDSGAEPLEV